MTKDQYAKLQVGDTVYSGKWPACVIRKDEDGILTGPWPADNKAPTLAGIKRQVLLQLTEDDACKRLEIAAIKVLDEDNRQKQLAHFRYSGTCSACIYSKPVIGRPWMEWCEKFHCEVDFNCLCDLYE